jgi:sugar lactone lactonase YvrE
MGMSTISAIRPRLAIPGGRISVEGGPFRVDFEARPRVEIGGVDAHVGWASATRLSVVVPESLEGGRLPIRVEGVPGATAFIDVGEQVATGLHQVDSPAIDADGVLYLTYSGTRGQQAPVSIYRVRPGGVREVFVTGVTNPTSLAIDPRGRLHVSSRFDGTVFRVDPDGGVETVATDLGVACGIAFASDGTLFVGDRTGTVFRITADAEAIAFASLPMSVAAFHLAIAPDDSLCATAPTLATRDAVYRIDAAGAVHELSREFGRPQGLAFDAAGRLFVVEALAGVSGIYRVEPGSSPELVLAGADLIGLAFDPRGGFVVTTARTAYRFTDATLA